ncbi:VASt domain [Sesbania bispinosa]|nr:VASt domain [Sesbania bispinosa]
MASTAVATASRAEPPPRPADPSPSSVDRNDSSNSSPNHFTDAEIQLQSPDILKSEEYRQLFRLPQEEVLIEDFNCALQENILIQGHMYLFVNFICFYSNIFGFETKRIIPFPEVTSVRRAKTAGLFPNAIEILAGSRKYFFASFLSRDEAFKIITDGWLRHAEGARAITEQQESISESSSQENGFIAVENVKSSEILDNESISTDPIKDTSMCRDVGLPSITGDDLVMMTVPEKQSSVEQVAEPELNNDAPNVSWNWNEEDIDAPTTPEAYTCVAESKFPEQNLVAAMSHLILDTSQEVSDVPYADYFRVEGLWDVERDKDESKECCILRVYVNVAFSKKTIWKGKIVQSTIEECREAYATWMNMAHELLKQKNVEKQENGSIPAVVQNDKMNCDREAKTGESSERSQEQINPTRRQATSIANHDTHIVSTQLQGNFIDASSVPSFFREFMTKFRSSLKSQSNLSLLLVTIFALIFFMQQFSILVLLARPQHIHVNTPVAYMNRMENGMTRSSSDIAWLEKRIHHLKDEMYMVETRLERMRYEHALLKKHLKDLEHK